MTTNATLSEQDHKCSRCSKEFRAEDVFRIFHDQYFHAHCFLCVLCKLNSVPNDEFLVFNDGPICEACSPQCSYCTKPIMADHVSVQSLHYHKACAYCKNCDTQLPFIGDPEVDITRKRLRCTNCTTSRAVFDHRTSQGRSTITVQDLETLGCESPAVKQEAKPPLPPKPVGMGLHPVGVRSITVSAGSNTSKTRKASPTRPLTRVPPSPERTAVNGISPSSSPKQSTLNAVYPGSPSSSHIARQQQDRDSYNAFHQTGSPRRAVLRTTSSTYSTFRSAAATGTVPPSVRDIGTAILGPGAIHALADDGGMTGNSVADASMRRPPPRAVLSGGGNNPVSNIVDAECAWSPPPVPRRPSMEDATHNSGYEVPVIHGAFWHSGAATDGETDTDSEHTYARPRLSDGSGSDIYASPVKKVPGLKHKYEYCAADDESIRSDIKYAQIDDLDCDGNQPPTAEHKNVSRNAAHRSRRGHVRSKSDAVITVPLNDVQSAQLSSLSALLADAAGIAAILDFAMDTFDIETILFWLDTEQFRHLEGSVDDVRGYAELISRKYLEGDAELAVDLPKEIRPVVVSRAANGPWTQDLFVDAQMHAFDTIQENILPKFFKSPHGMAYTRTLLDNMQAKYDKQDDAALVPSAARIESFEKVYNPSEKFYTYKIVVESATQTYVVWRRYSALHRLHMQLRRQFPTVQFDPFPGKRIFQRSQIRPVATKRKDELNAYLQSVMAVPQVRTSSHVCAFLRPGMDDIVHEEGSGTKEH